VKIRGSASHFAKHSGEILEKVNDLTKLNRYLTVVYIKKNKVMTKSGKIEINLNGEALDYVLEYT
jgi:hypothetical protein